MELFGYILVGISGLTWTIVYIELIRKGFKEKACGMPLFALTLNIGWEMLYSIDGLFIHKDAFILVQSIANLAWAICDVAIVVTWFLYGKQYLPERGKKYFIPYSITAVLVGVGMQLAFYFYCDTTTQASIYSAYAQNVAMSVLFLAMLFERDDTKAQSMTIAICKCIGTLTPTIYGQLNGINIYILITGIICFVLDLAYIYFLAQRKKQEKTGLIQTNPVKTIS